MHDSWLVVATFHRVKEEKPQLVSKTNCLALVLCLRFDLQSCWERLNQRKKMQRGVEVGGGNDRKEDKADYMENQKQTQTTFCIF